MQRVVQVLLNMRNAENLNVFQKHPINRIDHWFSEVCLQIWLQSRLKSNSLFEFWFLGRDLSFNDFAIFSTSGEIYELQFQVWGSKFELWKLWFFHCFTIFHRFLLPRQSRDIRRTRIAAVVTCWTFLKSDVAKHFSVKTYSTVLYSIFNVVQRLFLLSLCEWSR